MCFYNGIIISRSEYIRLMDLEIQLGEYADQLNHPFQSGFEYGSWPVVRFDAASGNAVLEMMHWDFMPSYFHTLKDVERFHRGGLNPKTGKKDPPKNMLNAIGEEMLDKPTFRKAALNSRCLVLSSGFYEWRHFTPPGLGKDVAYPYFVSLKGKEYFFIAGVWHQWTDRESGETINSFALVTTNANSLMAEIHNKKKRMPLIFTESMAKEWIRPDLPESRIREMVHFQIPSADMEYYTLEKRFRESGSPLEPFQYPELPPIHY